MAADRSLDGKILTAFRQTCVEGRLDVADHLLRAIEPLEGEPAPGSPLSKAYSNIAGLKGRKRPKQNH